MASLFKNRNIWFLAVSYKGKRITKSLGTTDKTVAKELKPLVESHILAELIGIIPKKKNIPFSDLVKKFLNAKHDWANTTYQLNKNILYRHLEGRALPSNPTSRAIHIRHINQCWNWGLKNQLITKATKLPGDTKGEARHRTYTADELKLMFAEIEDISFNSFVRFAYYTGARSGEIRSISRENVLDGSIVVRGKTGRREDFRCNPSHCHG